MKACPLRFCLDTTNPQLNTVPWYLGCIKELCHAFEASPYPYCHALKTFLFGLNKEGGDVK